jgi:hypothetical protein
VAPISTPQESKPDDTVLPKPVVEEAPKRISLLGLLVRALESEVPKFERERSIAEQVNAILQEKIEGTPYEEEGVSLFEQMDHTIGVSVGKEKFPGIDQVPNDEIRRLIRESVNEWTRRTMPG